MNLSCLLLVWILNKKICLFGASSQQAEHFKWLPNTNIGMYGGEYSNLMCQGDIE